MCYRAVFSPPSSQLLLLQADITPRIYHHTDCCLSHLPPPSSQLLLLLQADITPRVQTELMMAELNEKQISMLDQVSGAGQEAPGMIR